MSEHKHDFVKNYQGLLAQGFDRATDEATLAVYLQKLSDDDLLEVWLPRLDSEEIDQIFNWLRDTLTKHLSQEEYHRLFLKEAAGSHHE